MKTYNVKLPSSIINSFTPVNSAVKKHPLVEFEYPDSKTDKMRLRLVQVMEADPSYIKGFEIGNVAGEKPKYKQYSRDRIARNGVSLLFF